MSEDEHAIGGVAFVLGVNSQAGYYLSRVLFEKNYIVYGSVRSEESAPPPQEILNYPMFHLLYVDLLSACSLDNCVRHLEKQARDLIEVYCLAAVSLVSTSVSHPIESAETNAMGPLRLLDSIFRFGMTSRVRLLFASSSEIFGRPNHAPQDESTPFAPISPYGISKLFAMRHIKFHREYRDLFACAAILYNHESPRRPVSFVTRKITLTACAISKGWAKELEVGNLSARRDWGCAQDYARAMWQILQQDSADDFIVSSGELHTVRQLVTFAFQVVGMRLLWSGFGIDEVGIEESTGIVRVRVNPQFYRPEEKRATELTKEDATSYLVGDNSKLKSIGWAPTSDLQQLIRNIMEIDLQISQSSTRKALGLD